MIVYNHPYTCRFWYPYNAAYLAADFSIEMKAPEIGNKETRGRNQIFARTKSGNTIVADFGVKLNQELKLNFKAVPDIERAGLLLLLDAVNWGVSRLRYQDYRGDLRTIRVNANQLDSSDTGYRNRQDDTSILWDFDLDIIDVSDNINEQDGTLVPTALALHLLDYNSPHDPKAFISIGNETKTVEQWSIADWQAITWYVKVWKSGKAASYLVHAINNMSTGLDVQIDPLCDVGSVSLDVTLSVDINSGNMRLIATSTVTGPYTVECRRIKL